MKISPINLCSNFSFKQKKDICSDFYKYVNLNNRDTFERRTGRIGQFLDSMEETQAEKYLNSLGSQEEQLKQNETFTPLKVPFGVDKTILKNIDKINLKTIKNIKPGSLTLAKESAFLTNLTEEMLNEEYGENNWVFVCIGTSPAGIAKGLELKGHDVRYVPISSLNCLKDTSEIAKIKGAKEYKNFLDKIGLNKDTMAKDKRDYIICDFTASGGTLEQVRFIARQYLGIDDENVDYYSINKALMRYTIDTPKRKDCFDDVVDLISKHMGFGIIGDICGVPHLSYKNLDNIYLLLMEDKTVSERNFELALAYFIKKGGENEN